MKFEIFNQQLYSNNWLWVYLILGLLAQIYIVFNDYNSKKHN